MVSGGRGMLTWGYRVRYGSRVYPVISCNILLHLLSYLGIYAKLCETIDTHRWTPIEISTYQWLMFIYANRKRCL